MTQKRTKNRFTLKVLKNVLKSSNRRFLSLQFSLEASLQKAEKRVRIRAIRAKGLRQFTRDILYGQNKNILKITITLTLLDLLIDIDTRFSAFYRLASRLNYKLKNLRLELFRTFLISSFQWRTLYWPQMSFSTSFILKKKVISQGKCSNSNIS